MSEINFYEFNKLLTKFQRADRTSSDFSSFNTLIWCFSIPDLVKHAVSSVSSVRRNKSSPEFNLFLINGWKVESEIWWWTWCLSNNFVPWKFPNCRRLKIQFCRDLIGKHYSALKIFCCESKSIFYFQFKYSKKILSCRNKFEIIWRDAEWKNILFQTDDFSFSSLHLISNTRQHFSKKETRYQNEQ